MVGQSAKFNIYTSEFTTYIRQEAKPTKYLCHKSFRVQIISFNLVIQLEHKRLTNFILLEALEIAYLSLRVGVRSTVYVKILFMKLRCICYGFVIVVIWFVR